jgi:hypothetical protein
MSECGEPLATDPANSTERPQKRVKFRVFFEEGIAMDFFHSLNGFFAIRPRSGEERAECAAPAGNCRGGRGRSDAGESQYGREIEKEKGVLKAAKTLRPAIKRRNSALLLNPFKAVAKSPRDIGAVEIVADACIQLNRRMGAVHISLEADGPDKDEALAKFSRTPSLIQALQARIRPIDQIATLADSEIIVWICLLENCNDLEKIASRLAQVVSRDLSVDISAPTVGCAVHPLHGYTAAELIDAARDSAEHRSPILIPYRLS